jgi:murein DD-endopeptidase MepM/ murein hydrolase activator NlpD
MQILVTDGGFARTRVLQVSRLRLLLGMGVLCALLILMSGAIYHTILLKAANEGWPIVSQLVRLVVRDDAAQRDRVMRENLDAMAQRVGEMQAKLVKLEAMGERVSGLAGVKPEERQPLQQRPRGGAGGPYLPLEHPSLDELMRALGAMEEEADQHIDVLTLAESRLFESRLKALMVPSTRPLDGEIGSGFGFRSDPITGLTALHTGLDFSADIGAAIVAAAGGVVLASEFHPQYGQLLEIDHGNSLVTRYAHTSKILVKPGDLVRRGQVVAQVGTTGRSTGPHLHFEVLVDKVPQNPAKFLNLPAVPPLAGTVSR